MGEMKDVAELGLLIAIWSLVIPGILVSIIATIWLVRAVWEVAKTVWDWERK